MQNIITMKMVKKSTHRKNYVLDRKMIDTF